MHFISLNQTEKLEKNAKTLSTSDLSSVCIFVPLLFWKHKGWDFLLIISVDFTYDTFSFLLENILRKRNPASGVSSLHPGTYMTYLNGLRYFWVPAALLLAERFSLYRRALGSIVDELLI